MNDINVAKDKIAKLLAKAERTDNEAERDAYMTKAQKLMVQLGIDEAELEYKGEVKPEEIVEQHRDFGGNYAIVMIPFSSAVFNAFGNLQVLQSKPWSKSGLTRRIHVIGHKTDVEMALALLDSLHTQAMSALKVWQKANREIRRGRTDQWLYLANRSFLGEFGYTVARRIKATRQEVVEETATPGAALVLASKKDRVDAWVAQAYGELKPGRGGMRNGSYHGSLGGREAGERADIGGTRVGTGRSGELS